MNSSRATWLAFALTGIASGIGVWRFFGTWWVNPHMTQMQVFQANILWIFPIVLLAVASQLILHCWPTNQRTK